MIVQKPSIEQMKSLALWFYNDKTTPEGVLKWFSLRPHKYTIRGIRFNAISIANILRGMYIGVSMKKPRAKRKPKAKPEPVIEPDDEEIPF